MREKRPNVYGISREVWDHPAFPDEVYTERQAWAWLIGKASWRDETVRGNTKAVVKSVRGEFSVAVRYLAEKWLWTKDKTHRFLKKLEKHDMIRDVSRDGSQVYSITNYNRFQIIGIPKRDSDETVTATGPRQERDKIEETLKQGNNKKEDSPVLPFDVPSDFETFYAAYPRKIDRRDAERAYTKAIQSVSPATILTAVKQFGASAQFKDPKFIPHPATWLNKGRWEPELLAPNQPSPKRAFEERARQLFGQDADRHIRNFTLTYGEDWEKSASKLNEFSSAPSPTRAAGRWFFDHGHRDCVPGSV